MCSCTLSDTELKTLMHSTLEVLCKSLGCLVTTGVLGLGAQELTASPWGISPNEWTAEQEYRYGSLGIPRRLLN